MTLKYPKARYSPPGTSPGTGALDPARARAGRKPRLRGLPVVLVPVAISLLVIYTDTPLSVSGDSPDAAMAKVEERACGVLTEGRIPVVLGGEHTITAGAVKAVLAWNTRVGVVQLDAHADLRDEYAGSKLNHACTMRRVLDLGVPIFQIGVRSLSGEEAKLSDARGIARLDAVEGTRQGVPETVLPEDSPADIYLTIDVDALDPPLRRRS